MKKMAINYLTRINQIQAIRNNRIQIRRSKRKNILKNF